MKLLHPKGKLEAHPLALLLPEMSDTEYADLRERVRELGGLREDIVIYEGKVLDGRHRYKACLDEDIAPTFINYNPAVDGEFPVEFVMDKNVTRRNLNLSQLAAVAAASMVHFEAIAAAKKKKTQFGPGGKAPAPVEAPAAIVPPTAAPTAAAAPAGPTAGKDNVPEDELVIVPAVVPQADGAPSAPLVTPPPTEAPAPAVAPAPGGKKKPKDGSAAALVAEIFGTNRTMVNLAKRIRTNDEDLYQRVLNRKLTVNAAIEILDEREKAKKDTDAARQDKQRREDAINTIADKHGMESETYKAAKGKKILKKTDDLERFAAMKAKDTVAILKLLVLGWDLTKAEKYLSGKMTLENTMEDFINMALAQGKTGEPFVVQIGKWSFVATHTP